MKLQLGETLKRLRRDRDMTQEELATFLGVSFQSVSRWETGACYPDLELLPVMADFFGVSTDQLLGVDSVLEQRQVDEYLRRFQDAISQGQVDDCIRIAREGVAEHPNNYELLNKLMYALFVSGDEDGNIPNWRENMLRYDDEIIALGERMIKYCPDQDLRLEATARLAFHHQEMGRTAEARRLYESLPSQILCREVQMWPCLESDERLSFAQNQIRIASNCLSAGIYNLVFERLLPDEQLILAFEKAFAIFDLLRDGDTSGSQFPGARMHCLYAAAHARLGHSQEALTQLSNAAALANAWDIRPESGVHHCLLVGDTPWERNDFDTSDTRSCREIMRDKWLADTDFDSIRNLPEFQALLTMLS